MNPARRVLVGAAVLIAVIAGGTLGYVFIEDAASLDALYMTVITVSTIGFTEIIPLSDAGRVFTMGLIFVGVGTALFTATAALEVGLDNLIGRRHRYKAVRAIAKTHDHFIVCGYGRVGKAVVTHLDSAANPIVVISRRTPMRFAWHARTAVWWSKVMPPPTAFSRRRGWPGHRR